MTEDAPKRKYVRRKPAGDRRYNGRGELNPNEVVAARLTHYRVANLLAVSQLQRGESGPDVLATLLAGHQMAEQVGLERDIPWPRTSPHDDVPAEDPPA